MKVLLALALSFLAANCVETSPPWPSPPSPGPSSSGTSLNSFLKKASASEIRARAIAQAREDVEAGTPHVAWGGGYALHRPNIPADKEHFVAGLPPVKHVPAGCTDPLVRQGMIFAAAYNGELVKHLPLTKSC